MSSQAWPEIVATYEAGGSDWPSVRALRDLCRTIAPSVLAEGLHGWTSMLDLCISETEPRYPIDHPYLRISPIDEARLEFRYVDAASRVDQWSRVEPAANAKQRLLSFLEQLRWFPSDVLSNIDPGLPE